MSSLSAPLAVLYLHAPMFVPLWLPFRAGTGAPPLRFYFRIFVQQSLVKNGVIV